MTPGLHPALEPLETLDWARLLAFLEHGLTEDARLDYKDRVSPTFAATAAAMANGLGGTIVLGVREADNPAVPGTWDGLSGDPRAAAQSTIWAYCTPGFAMSIAQVTNPATGQALLVVAIGPSVQPPIWHRDHGVLVRVGDQNRPAPPELLEVWFKERAMGNPSVLALHRRVTSATMYGSPGFFLHMWPIAAVPRSRFDPETDRSLDIIAATALEHDQWEGKPRGSEYVLEAERPDRTLTSAVGDEAFVRHQYVARPQPLEAQVDLVETTESLLREISRRLVFGEIALERVCAAAPPLRVELQMQYGSRWRVSPPASALGFTDPLLPDRSEVEATASIETTLSPRGASVTGTQLLVGVLRRLGWRNFDSLVNYLTAHLDDAVKQLYARAGG
ncbi:MAG: ATP-binding protein [Chloroflexota bacterium]